MRESELLARVCAFVVSSGSSTRGAAMRLEPVATGVRWSADCVVAPRHVLRMFPSDRLFLLLDAALGPQFPGSFRPRAGQLQGPLGDLDLDWRDDGMTVGIRLDSPAAARLPPPAARGLRAGCATLVAGFPAGRALIQRRGRILPQPDGVRLPAFQGILRGDQRIEPGMSGSPVYTREGEGWRVAGMVLGASQRPSPDPGRAGEPRSWEGARIFPFFAP